MSKSRDLLKPAKALGMTLVSRLRCDASLGSLPPVVSPDRRGPGRPRVYGTWARPADELVDRSDSPWDSPLRRPSHADKRGAWRRALRGEEIRAVLRPGVPEEEILATAERLLSLAA
jgi:hypothetical protein